MACLAAIVSTDVGMGGSLVGRGAGVGGASRMPKPLTVVDARRALRGQTQAAPGSGPRKPGRPSAQRLDSLMAGRRASRPAQVAARRLRDLCPRTAEGRRSANLEREAHAIADDGRGAEQDTVSCDIDILNALLRGEVAAIGDIRPGDRQVRRPAAGGRIAAHPATSTRRRRRPPRAGPALRRRPVRGIGHVGQADGGHHRDRQDLRPGGRPGTLKQGEEYGIGQYEKP